MGFAQADIAQRLSVEPITAEIGAEIGGVDLADDLDDGQIAAIRAALLKWRVVVFRDQTRLDQASHIAFGRRFGEVTMAHTLADRPASAEHPEIYVLNLQELRKYPSFQPIGTNATPLAPARGDGWHTDLSFDADPPMGSILRAITVPEYGGDTMYTSLVGAYNALSTPVQDMLANLWAVHSIDRTDTKTGARAIDAAAVHPMVRIHPETGERVLFVNPGFTTHIVGLSRNESDRILQMCYEVITSERFSFRVRWKPGTVVFWDNRCTCHYGPVEMATATFERVMNRITIKGEPTYDVNGVTSRTLV